MEVEEKYWTDVFPLNLHSRIYLAIYHAEKYWFPFFCHYLWMGDGVLILKLTGVFLSNHLFSFCILTLFWWNIQNLFLQQHQMCADIPAICPWIKTTGWQRTHQWTGQSVCESHVYFKALLRLGWSMKWIIVKRVNGKNYLNTMTRVSAVTLRFYSIVG